MAFLGVVPFGSLLPGSVGAPWTLFAVRLVQLRAQSVPYLRAGHPANQSTLMTISTVPTSQPLLVRVARGEAVERPPVWAMRQAGRWDPEFNRIRGGLSFYEFSENVELSARASLLPRRFGVDGIILFYDITTLTVAMGLPFTLQPAQGPAPDHPIRTLADVERLEALPRSEERRVGKAGRSDG